MPRFATATLQRVVIHTAADGDMVAQFAAEELQQYLERMTGVRLPIRRGHAPACAIVLGPVAAPAGTAAPPDGFTIVPEPEGITLTAGSTRALLDAVYALLQQLGCRWSLHGPSEETVPQLSAPAVDLDPITQAPRFSVRGYCTDIMTWHYTQPEHFHDRFPDDRAFIDWMGKSGANAFFFIRHPFDTQLTISELLPEFQRRGIAVEYGGHVIPLLLPRELFREYPEYFPEGPDGTRTDHGNLCPSNRAALAAASGNALRYLRDYPEMRVMHIWGADLWRGGWCGCRGCAGMSVQDQSLRVCNAVARGLAEAGTARPVCYLAYHDTIDPVLTLRPEAEVFVEFAPRERCYGHALADPECATNRRYAVALERYVELFEGRVRLFEYYGDAILFFGCAVPLTRVIAADLDYYERLGVREITLLQFGTYSLWAYPLNFLTYAYRLTGGRPTGRAGEEYCAHFGVHAPAASAAFAELEEIMRGVVTYGDIRRPPRSAEAAGRVHAALDAAVPRLRVLAQRLDRLGDERLAAQAALLRYTEAILIGARRDLEDILASRRPRGAVHYTDALPIMEAIERRFKGLWGDVDLPIVHGFFSAADHSE